MSGEASSILLPLVSCQSLHLFVVHLCIINDVRDIFLNEQSSFFGEELERQAEKDVLLIVLGEGANEAAEDVVILTDAFDGGYVVQVISMSKPGNGSLGCIGLFLYGHLECRLLPQTTTGTVWVFQVPDVSPISSSSRHSWLQKTS